MCSFTLATGGYDNSIRFFDATNQTMIRTIQFCDQQVLRLAFSGDRPVSSDAPLYLIAGGSPSVAVYDVSSQHTSPTLFQVYQGHSEAITAVGFEPRHTAFVYSASEDGTLQTWLPQLAPMNVQQQHHYQHLSSPHAALHPLAAGATLEDGRPRFPSVPARMRNDGRNGPVPIHDAVYYPPTDLFFTADHAGRLGIWRHATALRTATLIPHPSKRNLQCLDLSSDYRLLVVANFDGLVFLYHVDNMLADPSSAVPVSSFRANSTYIPRVRLSVTISLLVCTTSSGVIKVFRLADVMGRGAPLRLPSHASSDEQSEESVTPIREFTGHPGWVWDAAFVEDRDDYLFTCSSNMQVMLWALNDIQSSIEYAGHEKGVVCLAVRERMSAGVAPEQFGPPQHAEHTIHPPNNANPLHRVTDDEVAVNPYHPNERAAHSAAPTADAPAAAPPT